MYDYLTFVSGNKPLFASVLDAVKALSCFQPMTAKVICRVVIAAVSLVPVYGLGQKADLPQGVWVNCNPPSGKNAIVIGPAVIAKNGSRAWVQVVSAVAPLEGMCLNKRRC